MALKDAQAEMSLNAYQEAVIYSHGQWLTQKFDTQGRDATPNAVWGMDRGGRAGQIQREGRDA